MFEKKEFEIGGLKITRNVEKEEINNFVSMLPAESKKDMKNVLMNLHEEGLITIEEKEN